MKTRGLFIYLFMLFACGIVCFSCSDSDEEKINNVSNPDDLLVSVLVGHWRFFEAIYDDGEFGDFIINEDGTYTALFDSKRLSGTWEYTRTASNYPSLIIYYEENGETQSLEFEISVLDDIELRITGINAYQGVYISYERVE